MNYIGIEEEQYKTHLEDNNHVFNSLAFQKLNANKVDEVVCIGFEQIKKTKIGLVGGVKDQVFKSPFSSPFGGFSFYEPVIRLVDIEQAIDELLDIAQVHQWSKIRFSLPPSIYPNNIATKQLNCFLNKGFKIEYVDLNYSFLLEKYTENYLNTIKRSARKSLNKALKITTYSFSKAITLVDQEEAYQVIVQNRTAKGYPLHLSWQDIQATSTIIEIDFFIVHLEKVAVAAALIFWVTPTIVQVVYWGDIPAYQAKRPMNYLSYKIFDYYKDKATIIDIGPSTERGIPNHGLCEFKEGIGCDITPKYTLSIDL